MKHPHKRARKIAEAVFRGQKTQYKFDVFPLTADITDAPAIFIISRRTTDKFRKGHHSAICLGETDSIQTELKKHKRAKCVKQHEANVVCILKDADAASRGLVVDDLQTARSFSCIRNADQPNIKAKRNVKTTKIAPVVAAASKRKKSSDVPVEPSKAAKAGKSNSSRAVAAKRPAAKRTNSAAKPKQSAAPTKRKSTAKKPVAASPKRRTRVQGGVDSKRGQHRLSKPKKSVDRRAKSRTTGRSRPGKKAAA